MTAILKNYLFQLKKSFFVVNSQVYLADNIFHVTYWLPLNSQKKNPTLKNKNEDGELKKEQSSRNLESFIILMDRPGRNRQEIQLQKGVLKRFNLL